LSPRTHHRGGLGRAFWLTAASPPSSIVLVFTRCSKQRARPRPGSSRAEWCGAADSNMASGRRT